MSEARQQTPVRPRDAASLVILRGRNAATEVLLGRRAAKHRFMPNVYVFPGGRVDDEDRAGLDTDDELGAARRAAVREAHEEAGLAVSAEGMVPFSHWAPPSITPRRPAISTMWRMPSSQARRTVIRLRDFSMPMRMGAGP